MKGLSRLQKLKLKRDFHLKYSQHGGRMSGIIIKGLNELIEKEELIKELWTRKTIGKGKSEQ